MKTCGQRGPGRVWAQRAGETTTGNHEAKTRSSATSRFPTPKTSSLSTGLGSRWREGGGEAWGQGTGALCVPTRKRGPPQQRREAHTAPRACPSRSRQIRRDLRGKCHPATFPVAPLRGACTDSLLSSRTTCEELKCIKGHNRDSEKAAWGRPEMLLSRHRKTNPFKHWRRTRTDVSPEGAQPRRPPGRRESRPPRGTGSHPSGRSRLKGERTAGAVRENGGLGHRGRGAKRRVPRRLSAQSAKPLPGVPLKPPRAEPVPRRPPSLHVAAPRSSGLGDRGAPEPRPGRGAPVDADRAPSKEPRQTRAGSDA